MKRLLSLLIVVAFVFTGCTVSGPSLQDALDNLETKPSPTQQTEPGSITLPPTEPTQSETLAYPYPQQLCGVYSVPNMENGEEQYLQIYYLGGTYLLEFSRWKDGSCYEFWAKEFWPDGQLYEEAWKVSGLNQDFFGPHGPIDSYSFSPFAFSLTKTDSGLILCSGESEMVGYVSVDRTQVLHPEPQQLLGSLESRYTGQSNCEATGTWLFTNGEAEAFVDFSEDGTFRYYCKEPYQPLLILEGGWLWDSKTGDILCMYQSPGRYYESEAARIHWSIEAEGTLILSEADELIPYMVGCSFAPAPKDWGSQMSIDQKIGLVRSYWDVEGEYLADNIYTEYYRYRLPQIIAYSDDATRINQQIIDTYESTIYEHLDIIESGGYRYYNTIDWYQWVRDDVLSLMITAVPMYYNRTFTTYFYDYVSQVQLSNRQMLARFGISEEDYLSQLHTQAEEIFLMSTEYMTESEKEDEAYKSALSRTLSEDNIHTDLPMYLGQDVLYVYVRIYSCFGEEWYDATVSIDIP